MYLNFGSLSFPIELRCLHLIDLNDGSEDISKISGAFIFVVEIHILLILNCLQLNISTDSTGERKAGEKERGQRDILKLGSKFRGQVEKL